MEYVAFFIIIALVFGLCFLADKLFTKLFRGKAQHKSGLSVRLSKRYGSMGIIIAVLGVAALFAGLKDPGILLAGGILLIPVGLGLVVYYMTFGIYYDEDGFILSQFGRHSNTYHYRDIQAQQLYLASGNVVVELHMSDGRTVSLQSAMTGQVAFLNFAFDRWLQETGKNREDCTFHDPDNSCWFPPVEG